MWESIDIRKPYHVKRHVGKLIVLVPVEDQEMTEVNNDAAKNTQAEVPVADVQVENHEELENENVHDEKMNDIDDLL